ncbi:MAG TPA: aminodeoxychorismate/anthranilate synthase component II [Pirellulaceae bacterium]|nr:aminodeoxychorismate/anthranilate synthase component II [Pirellulaceae bacterium]
MLLLIDNYDSFVHNLARYLRRLGCETQVVRNDALTPDQIARLRPAAIVLSPGPCTPNEAGHSLEIVKQLAGTIPMLGVCLGHQTIGSALGARIVRAPAPMHGRTSQVEHGGEGLFADLPSPLTVGRYHSLVVDRQTLPDELVVTAQTADGVVMALAHTRWPVFGVQFHPESILTEGGYTILANFLRLAGIAELAELPRMESELPRASEPSQVPSQPVTF